jgi:hypothetical protein
MASLRGLRIRLRPRMEISKLTIRNQRQSKIQVSQSHRRTLRRTRKIKVVKRRRRYLNPRRDRESRLKAISHRASLRKARKPHRRQSRTRGKQKLLPREDSQWRNKLRADIVLLRSSFPSPISQ